MYKTNSLQAASYLYSKKDLIFKGVDSTDCTKISFLFEPFDKAQNYMNEYFSGKVEVNLLEIFQNFKALKDMVFEIKRNIGARPL